MTVDEGARYFEQNAYEAPRQAPIEATRCSVDLSCPSYQLGKLMIMKLREDFGKRDGSSFNLAAFHEAFLSEGAIPIQLIRHAMLGNDAGPLISPPRPPPPTPSLGVKIGPSKSRGAKIDEVFADSAAAKAGLKAGDLITAFNGKSVANRRDVVNAVAQAHVNDTVPIEIERGGRRQTIKIQIGERAW
jgi:hypothetical protein